MTFDKKVIRINGPLNTSWRKLTRENIVFAIAPDVTIESTRVAEAKRKRNFAEFSAFSQVAMQDHGTNCRYVLRKLGRISGLNSAELFLMFPSKHRRAEGRGRESAPQRQQVCAWLSFRR
jgi:hypothetical protein